MNTGMELMGMRECRECGDPYTITEDDTGVCGGCIMRREFAALRAQLATVTRERDDFKVRAQLAEQREHDICAAVGGVSDGGKYRADVIEHLRAVFRERDDLKARVTAANSALDVLEDKYATLRHSNDAAEARVTELEAQVAKLARGLVEESRARVEESRARNVAEAAPSPTVVVTREMVETLAEEMETRAVWTHVKFPLNAAARLIVAWRKALEVKP